VKPKAAGVGKYTGSGNVMMVGKGNVTISVKQNGKQTGQKKVAVTAKGVVGQRRAERAA
jgi:hypothetical protein